MKKLITFVLIAFFFGYVKVSIDKVERYSELKEWGQNFKLHEFQKRELKQAYWLTVFIYENKQK